jgi:hypothetical protein
MFKSIGVFSSQTWWLQYQTLNEKWQAFQLHGYLYTLYFLAYFGDMFFSLFSIIWGHSVTAHKKIAHLEFQALIYVI